MKCRDNQCWSVQYTAKYREWQIFETLWVTHIVLWNNMWVHREARSGSFRDPPMGPDFGKKHEWQLMGRDKYFSLILFQLCHELHIWCLLISNIIVSKKYYLVFCEPGQWTTWNKDSVITLSSISKNSKDTVHHSSGLHVECVFYWKVKWNVTLFCCEMHF